MKDLEIRLSGTPRAFAYTLIRHLSAPRSDEEGTLGTKLRAAYDRSGRKGRTFRLDLTLTHAEAGALSLALWGMAYGSSSWQREAKRLRALLGEQLQAHYPETFPQCGADGPMMVGARTFGQAASGGTPRSVSR